MKNFQVMLILILSFSIQSLQAEDTSVTQTVVSTDVNTTTTNPVTTIVNDCTEPETDDKLNPELLNTLPDVNILNLSGVDCNGIVIDCFIIHTLPSTEAGTLYLANGETEVTSGLYLTIEESDSLHFDPNENFEGNASFTYCSVDNNDVIDPTPATVILPIVAPVVNGDSSDECNTSVIPVVHNASCTCEAYEMSIPVFSKLGFFVMFILSVFIGTFFMRKEI